MTQWYVTWGRLLILLLAAETALRYAWWWWRLRPSPGANTGRGFLLRRLMGGINVSQAGYFLLMWSALRHSPSVELMSPIFSFVLPMGYTLVIAGLYYHLIPCWQLTCQFSGRRLWVECLWRALMTAIAATVTIL